MGATLKGVGAGACPLLAMVAMALLSSPASAGQYCANNTVNNVQKCFGSPQEMNEAQAVGIEIGVCVSENTVRGTCVPMGGVAVDMTSLGISPAVGDGHHAQPDLRARRSRSNKLGKEELK